MMLVKIKEITSTYIAGLCTFVISRSDWSLQLRDSCISVMYELRPKKQVLYLRHVACLCTVRAEQKNKFRSNISLGCFRVISYDQLYILLLIKYGHVECVCRVWHGRGISNHCINSVPIKSRDCNRANVTEILRFLDMS